MSLVSAMLARVGKVKADVNPQSTAGKLFRRRGVDASTDFHRIKSLPQRDWRDGLEGFSIDQVQDYLTGEYGRLPGQCKESCICGGQGSMRLKPVQAAALAEMHDYQGLFAPMAVGSGKTLLSFLGARVVEAERPWVLCPANLRDKTDRDWLALSKHWRLPDIRVESYEKLGRASNAQFLMNARPDYIFADEGHKLKNKTAAVTRRVERYLKAARKEGRRVVFCVGSGTTLNDTIRDFWHLLRWTLGDFMCPLPVDWQEMMQWADCLDVKSDKATRMAPGVLVHWSDGNTELDAVREGVGKRLVMTPGVVSNLGASDVNASLLITSVDVNLDHLGDQYDQLRNKMETPDGYSFTERSQLWAHARELTQGFYYVWDPRPPLDWMWARKTWHQFVRSVLRGSRTLDTEFQVAVAANKGELDTWVEEVNPATLQIEMVDVYARWVGIRDTFKPNSVPRWVDDTTLRYCAQWIKDHNSLVWVEHPPFGERLAAMAGVPYFGRGGYAGDLYIEDSPGGGAVASVLANGTGKNLQGIWSNCLVSSCLPNGKTMEQLIGRLHRPGQKADQVEFQFVAACREQVAGFEKVTDEARLIERMQREPQKWSFADRMIPSVDDLDSMTNPRWQQNR